MAKHDEDDERRILKKQAELERTRMIKLRHNEAYSHDEDERDPVNPIHSMILPLIIVAGLFFIGSRVISLKSNSIPEHALRPTMNEPKPGHANYISKESYAEALEKQYAFERAATDEEVKRMLAEMNGTPSEGPRSISPAQTGQTLNFSGAQTPEMVRVQGKWFRKNEQNVYRVNGQNIYYEDRRRERR